MLGRLPGTTALTPIGPNTARNRRPKHKKSNPIVTVPKGAKNVKISGVIFDGGDFLVERAEASDIELDRVDIASLTGAEPTYVTKHFEGKYLGSWRAGYLRIGTLVRYRDKEGNQSGRLSDYQESRQHERLSSEGGVYKSIEAEGLQLKNVSVVDGDVVIETVFNDFCVCFSNGRFDPTRGLKLKEMETDVEKKPSAYVTYDLQRLKAAILETLDTTNPEVLPRVLVGRQIVYGIKDEEITVPEVFRYAPVRDTVRTWMKIAFVKPESFSHEDEYRLLLVSPGSLGSLKEDTREVTILESANIAAAIVEWGEF